MQLEVTYQYIDQIWWILLWFPLFIRSSFGVGSLRTSTPVNLPLLFPQIKEWRSSARTRSLAPEPELECLSEARDKSAILPETVSIQPTNHPSMLHLKVLNQRNWTAQVTSNKLTRPLPSEKTLWFGLPRAPHHSPPTNHVHSKASSKSATLSTGAVFCWYRH